MLTIPLLVALLSQALLGSAYVVVEEENGYYRAWRSNPSEQKQNSWSPFMNSQNYFPFLQNMNPFSWMWQAQQAQDNSALNILYERQKVLFDMMKCLIEDGPKMMCKHLLGNAMPLFPGSAQVSEIWITNPDAPKPMDGQTVIIIGKPEPEAKPTMTVMMETKPELAKPLDVEAKPEMATKSMEGKPFMVEAEPTLIEVRLLSADSVDEMKPKPTTMEIKPLPADSKAEMKPDPTKMEMKPLPDDSMAELKPDSTKTEMKPLSEDSMTEMKPEPATMEIKPLSTDSMAEIKPDPTKMEMKPLSEDSMAKTKPEPTKMEISEMKSAEPLETEKKEEKEMKPTEAAPAAATEDKSMEMKPEPSKRSEDSEIKPIEAESATVEVKTVNADAEPGVV